MGCILKCSVNSIAELRLLELGQSLKSYLSKEGRDGKVAKRTSYLVNIYSC